MSKLSRLRAALLVLLSTPILLLAACSSGEEGDELEFDPANADQISHGALVAVSDLPGSGWTVKSNDDFRDQSEAPVDTAACEEISEFRKQNGAVDGKDRAGRAQRGFERRVAGVPVAMALDVKIEIYSNPESLGPRLQQAREFISRRIYQDCYADILKDALGEDGRSMTGNAVPPTGGVPQDGFGMAVEATNITGLQGGLRVEFYGWVRSNAAITLTAQGTNATLTAELINAAVQKTNAALDAAATK